MRLFSQCPGQPIHSTSPSCETYGSFLQKGNCHEKNQQSPDIYLDGHPDVQFLSRKNFFRLFAESLLAPGCNLVKVKRYRSNAPGCAANILK